MANKNKLMSKALQLLEENVPIELILNNQNEDPAFHELEKHSEVPSDDLLNLAIELYKIWNKEEKNGRIWSRRMTKKRLRQ